MAGFFLYSPRILSGSSFTVKDTQIDVLHKGPEVRQLSSKWGGTSGDRRGIRGQEGIEEQAWAC